MKTRKLLFLAASATMAMMVWSCANVGSMQKKMSQFNAKVSPDPLEVHGDSIAVTISGKFPEKFFAKKVSVEASPILHYGSSEVKMKSKLFKGEDAPGNGDVIPFETGKSFSYNDKIAYAPSMLQSDLKLKIVGSQGSKTVEFPEIDLAKGVITTSLMVDKKEVKLMTAADSYTSKSGQLDATIFFDYNSSTVKANELKDQDMNELVNFLSKTLPGNPRMKISNIDIQSYASVEGELLLNKDLSTARAEAGKKALLEVLKKNKLDAAYTSMIQLNSNGEDWINFKSEMEKSAIEDRELIIRVLQKTTDLQERETEIKNITKTYTEIEKQILPKLRRDNIRVNYSMEKFSDQELKTMAANPSNLNYEELLRAGSLVSDANVQIAVYKEAEKKAEGDNRAANNLGVVYFNQGKLNEAKAQFEKAYGIKKSSDVACNLGAVSKVMGDNKKAVAYFNESSSSEAKYNKVSMDVQTGNYGAAINNAGSFKTFNTALARCLNKDYSGAKADLEACNMDNGSAQGHYLMAVIAARMNDAAAVKSNLDKAVQKDAKMADKAKTDLEFRNFQGK
jgi:tetratricopeptide (TPR) repeat protein